MLVVLAFAAVSGCGYSTTSRTARDIKSIFVPFFDNKTAEPNLEITVTERLINFMILDNTLKVVDEDEADAILEGEISQFRNQPFSFNQDLNAQEYIVVIKVIATLYNRKTNESIWQSRSFEGNGSYFVEGAEDGRTFNDAVAECIEEITDQILNITVQDW
jgi:outer membrane lipopolysaccharide assembly protein LptE/RlpB